MKKSQRLENKKNVLHARLQTHRVMPTTEDPQARKKPNKIGTSKPYPKFYAATRYMRLCMWETRVPYVIVLQVNSRIQGDIHNCV